MQRKLSSIEIETFTIQAKEIYRESKFSEELSNKLITLDIQAIYKLLEWIDILEKHWSMDKVIESSKFYQERQKQIPEELKKIGCTEKEYKEIILIAPKFAEISIVKEVKDLYVRIANAIGMELNYKLLTKDIEQKDISDLSQLTSSTINIYENKNEKTNEEKELLKSCTEANNFLKDEDFVNYLTKKDKSGYGFFIPKVKGLIEVIASSQSKEFK